MCSVFLHSTHNSECRRQNEHDWVERRAASVASSKSDDLWEDSGGIEVSLEELSIAEQVDRDARFVSD